MASQVNGTTADEPTVLIVGAGVFGTSTAYHLAQTYTSPSKITLLDRSPIPSPQGASADINKIIRADYSSAFYSRLATEALEAWATWPELTPFYHRTGWIMLGAEGSDLAQRARAVFRETRGTDPTEDVPLHALEGKWGGVLQGTSLKGLSHAYWNPEAGWCEADKAVESLARAAVAKGVKVVSGEVTELLMETGRGGISGVRLEDGTILTADKVVLATGAWTSVLLSPVEDALGIAEPDRVEKQTQATGVNVAHYKMSPAEIQRLADMPVVVYGERGEVIPPPKDSQLLKFTNVNTFTNLVETASGHRISVPPDRNQHIVPEKLKRDMENLMTTQVMPTFTDGKQVDHWRICWDGRTPTQDWLLCRHPHTVLQNLYFAVGGSFHSYKFLPNVGKYMVNVLNGKGNGTESDRAWAWKTADANWRGAHEKTAPIWDLRDIEETERDHN